MFSKLLCITILVSLLAAAYGECTNPEISVNSFTTSDATIVSQIGYIAEFLFECEGKTSLSLFAEIGEKIIPVARTGKNTYQISWSEEIKKSRSADIKIRLFDENGFSEIRKAQRSGDDLSLVQALTEFVVNHPGAYKGPWVNSELLATAVAAFVAYFAFSAKSKILS